MAKQNVELPDEKEFTRRPKKTVHSDRPERAHEKSGSDLSKDSQIALMLGTKLKSRMDGLVDYYGARMGVTTRAAFIRKAIEEKVAAGEKEFNNGEPLEPVEKD